MAPIQIVFDNLRRLRQTKIEMESESDFDPNSDLYLGVLEEIDYYSKQKDVIKGMEENER